MNDNIKQEDIQEEDIQEEESSRADEIDIISDRTLFKKIVKALADEIKEKSLLCLTAPEVGYNYRIFAINFNGDIQFFTNPKISRGYSKMKISEKMHFTRERYLEKDYIVFYFDEVVLNYQTVKGLPECNKFISPASDLVQSCVNKLDGIFPSDPEIGLEVLEGFDNLTDDEQLQIINMFREYQLKLKDYVNEEISKDEELSKISKAIEFMDKVAAGEIEFEKLEKDSSKEKDIKALNRSMNKRVMSSFVGTKRTKRHKKKR